MEHSLEKYIDRQSTAVLQFLYNAYLQKPDDEINKHVFACIQETLLRRSGEHAQPSGRSVSTDSENR